MSGKDINNQSVDHQALLQTNEGVAQKTLSSSSEESHDHTASAPVSNDKLNTYQSTATAQDSPKGVEQGSKFAAQEKTKHEITSDLPHDNLSSNQDLSATLNGNFILHNPAETALPTEIGQLLSAKSILILSLSIFTLYEYKDTSLLWLAAYFNSRFKATNVFRLNTLLGRFKVNSAPWESCTSEIVAFMISKCFKRSNNRIVY